MKQTNKQINSKGFYTLKWQPISVEEIMQFEKYYLSTIIIIINTVKKHQQK